MSKDLQRRLKEGPIRALLGLGTLGIISVISPFFDAWDDLEPNCSNFIHDLPSC